MVIEEPLHSWIHHILLRQNQNFMEEMVYYTRVLTTLNLLKR